MMDDVATQKLAEGQAEFKLVPPPESAETLALYSNFAQATMSPHDMTMHFGWYAIPPLIEPPEGAVDVEIRPLVKVTIPLNLVRGVIDLLERQLSSWQESFGEAGKGDATTAAKDASA